MDICLLTAPLQPRRQPAAAPAGQSRHLRPDPSPVGYRPPHRRAGHSDRDTPWRYLGPVLPGDASPPADAVARVDGQKQRWSADGPWPKCPERLSGWRATQGPANRSVELDQ